ncbi:MAG: hypothetical protein WCI22_13965 [Actinomycetota bacterium]
MSGPDGALAALRSGTIWVGLTTNRKELVASLAANAPRWYACGRFARQWCGRSSNTSASSFTVARSARATLWNAIKESVGDSFAGHYDPSFSLDLCLKDLGLITAVTALAD